MPTPLYDALKQYAARDPGRFHMPGHKGKILPVPELADLSLLDVTELPPTGNLYEAPPSTLPSPFGPRSLALTTANFSPAGPPWESTPA